MENIKRGCAFGHSPFYYSVVTFLFRNYFKWNFNRNFFVEFQCCLIITHFFHRIFDVDNLAVDVESGFSQGFCHLDIRYRTEEVFAPIVNETPSSWAANACASSLIFANL